MDEGRQEVEEFLAAHPDIEVVEALLVDVNGVHRGKWIPVERLGDVFAGTFKLPLTAVTPDIWGRDVPALCERTGDGDGVALPTARTLKRLPWVDRPTAQIYLHLTHEGSPFGWDPRVVLSALQARFAARGLTPVIAAELEFTLLSAERDDAGVPRLPASELNGGRGVGGQLFSTDLMHEFAAVLDEMRTACNALDLGLETLVKEAAPGQYELNLTHLPDALAAADNAQMLKRVIKGVARKHGFVATFMAKPFIEEDGNGFHTHLSVLDTQGRNIFDDGTDKGSPALGHAIAGMAATMAEFMLIFAPHRNSYRRFATGTHVPHAPNWAYEDRYVALRIPMGPPAATRIEHRVAGADANPYLVFAALLAGVLHGLDNALPPPPPQAGAVPERRHQLPGDWLSATRAFEASDIAPAYLGTPFVEALLAIKRAEQAQFDGTISVFEYDSYLIPA